ncbi:MAG: phosphotransferase enzyme family protein [Acidimicrobiales bacterium]
MNSEPAHLGPSRPVIAEVLDRLGVARTAVRTLKDEVAANSSWLVETTGGGRVVLRRYHEGATPEDLDYEHQVLRHLTAAGWWVPIPESDLISHRGRLFCLNRWVPGGPLAPETPDQRQRRGRDLARLHRDLRDLGGRLGQRRGWQAQHAGPTVHTGLDPVACVEAFAVADPARAEWAAVAIAHVERLLQEAGAGGLPTSVVHGDFAEWNVHYEGGRLAGVIDFGLTHLDSRPYELAIARTYRAPEAASSYLEEAARLRMPFTELELACLEPIYRAFRVDMTLWELEEGRRRGTYDIGMIERQLSRTGAPRP